MLKFVLQGY